MSDNTTNIFEGEPADDTSSRRKLVIGATAVTAVGAAAAITFIVASGGGDDAITTADAPSTTVATTTTTIEPSQVFTAADTAAPVVTEPVATTTTTSTTTTTTTVPPTTVALTIPDTLPEQPPEPIAPPADPRGAEDQIQIGGIAIPSLGVDAPLLEGIRLTTLDNGPGHWPGTAMPGEVGNVVVAAHRTSHGGPFRHIDQLVAGDVVQFTTADGQIIDYSVTGTQIVEPDALWIVDPTETATATLFACHPPGSVAQRIVVNLELAG